MRPFPLLAALLLVVYYASSSASEPSLPAGVLVTSAESTLAPFRLGDLRRLYLGVPLQQGGKWVKPLINGSNLRLREEFLQKILYMSSENYDRQLISSVFRRGGTRPIVYKNRDELIKAIQTNPNSITFMRAGTVRASEGIRTVQRLW